MGQDDGHAGKDGLLWHLRPRSPVVAALAGLGALTIAETFIWEPERITVDHWTIPLRNLPPEFAGVTIAQLSDFHIRARGWRPETMRRAIARTQQLGADMIVLIGDFIDANDGAALLVDLFNQLHAPLGIYAVLGNHDYYISKRRPALITHALTQAGVRVLNNEAVSIERNGAHFWICGVEDDRMKKSRPDAVLANLPPDGCPRLLLLHYPDMIQRVRPGDWDVVLSGHTHGGQLNLPILARMAARRQASTAYLQGMYRVNDTILLISRGIGTIGVPGRLFAPPQINLIHLQAAIS